MFYSYSFYWGGRLRYKEVMNRGSIYSGGAILSIMFSTIFGALQLGGVGPHAKAINEGQIAGKLAFDVID
jgi:hypothetical protein